MTVDKHVSQSEILILNVSGSTDVKTKYQQTKNKQFKQSIKHFERNVRYI